MVNGCTRMKTGCYVSKSKKNVPTPCLHVSRASIFHSLHQILLVLEIRYRLECWINLAKKLLDKSIFDAFLLMVVHGPIRMKFGLMEPHEHKIIHSDAAIIIKVSELKDLPEGINSLFFRLIALNFHKLFLANLWAVATEGSVPHPKVLDALKIVGSSKCGGCGAVYAILLSKTWRLPHCIVHMSIPCTRRHNMTQSAMHILVANSSPVGNTFQPWTWDVNIWGKLCRSPVPQTSSLEDSTAHWMGTCWKMCTWTSINVNFFTTFAWVW